MISYTFEISVTFQLGSDIRISFRHHDWRHGILKFSLQHLFSHCVVQNAKVQELQDVPSIRHDFTPVLATSAQRQLQFLRSRVLPNSLVLSHENTGKLIRNLSTDGKFSSKSFYRFLTDTTPPTECIDSIWKPQVPPKVNVFAWFVLKDKILTIDNFKRRG